MDWSRKFWCWMWTTRISWSLYQNFLLPRYLLDGILLLENFSKYILTRAGVAILKLVGPGPYPPKKSGGARARFYPISAKKWWGPGPTGPYPDYSPAFGCRFLISLFKCEVYL